MVEAMPGERWLPAPGFPDYLVSDQGRVYSIPRIDSLNRRQGGRLLSTKPGANGYPMARVARDRVSTLVLVHRLVAEAFIGPCPTGQEVRHKDGVRDHCTADNLEYGTSSENQFDKVRHGTHHYAKRNKCKNGHELTGGNVSIIRWPDGTFRTRSCLACRRERAAERSAAKVAALPVLVIRCPECGTDFEKPRGNGKNRRKYCSKPCQDAAQRRQSLASQKRLREERQAQRGAP